MTDVTQGAQAPDDASLFTDATSTTLEKFENADPLPPPPAEKPDAPKDAPKDKEPVVKPDAPDAPVPAGRLREESDARRRAERERDDLQRQLLAVRQPPQAPAAKPDMFDNPSGFVKSEVQPFFEQMRQEMQMQREAFSQQFAVQVHGSEKVAAARQSLEQGMSRGDQDAWGAYNRAMQSANPYDVITRWHLNNETMREVGGDINGYRQRVLDEAMKDPEFQAKVIAASKGTATHVARPVIAASPVPKIPSLGNVGAGGGDTEPQEPSDEQLFRAATTAKRR